MILAAVAYFLIFVLRVSPSKSNSELNRGTEYSEKGVTTVTFKKFGIDPPFKPLSTGLSRRKLSEIFARQDDFHLPDFQDELDGVMAQRSRKSSVVDVTAIEINSFNDFFMKPPENVVLASSIERKGMGAKNQDINSINLIQNVNHPTPFDIGSIDFDLESDALSFLKMSSDIKHHERQRLLGLVVSKGRRLSAEERIKSIQRYIYKKGRRRSSRPIRYKVRQDLACKRKRVNGKFVKTKKLDLKLALYLLDQGHLIRAKELRDSVEDRINNVSLS